MTLKEQSQSVVLLRKWFELVSKLPRERRTPEAAALLDETDRFINHEDAADDHEEESHGQRRG